MDGRCFGTPTPTHSRFRVSGVVRVAPPPLRIHGLRVVPTPFRGSAFQSRQRALQAPCVTWRVAMENTPIMTNTTARASWGSDAKRRPGEPLFSLYSNTCCLE